MGVYAEKDAQAERDAMGLPQRSPEGFAPLPTKPKGDPRFHQLLRELGELHDLKQEDYGTDSDPFANVRGSIDWDVEPWRGGLVRMGDKVTRLKQYAKTRSLSNEGVEDTLKDLAVYALITLILWREEHDEETGSG